MILITGMPRTASSFLNIWFRDMGAKMKPKCYSTYMPTGEAVKAGMRFNLCEPIQLTEMLSTRPMPREAIEREIGLIYAENLSSSGNNRQVVKCSPMAFFKSSFGMFERVIITVRDLDSWCKSAENHGSYGWINRSRPMWLDGYYHKIINAVDSGRRFGEIWLEESIKAYEYCLNKGIPCDIYEYANDESFKKLHLVYGITPRKHTDYQSWIGRRF